MDSRSIPQWMIALVGCCVVAAMLINAGLPGLIWGIPTLYVIPYMIARIRLGRVRVTDDDIWAWVDRG